MARRLRPASAWLAEAVSAEEAAAGSPPCTRMRKALRDDLRPMLASLDDAPRVSPGLVYEPKYDGIRAIVEINPREAPDPRARARGGRAPRASNNDDSVIVQIYSRLGNEKTSQFPALVEVFQQIGRKLGGRLIIDGEIVALDKAGKPMGFQRLQGRMHLTGAKDIQRMEGEQPVAYIAFDLLRDGDDDLRPRPWTERRARLEARLGKLANPDGPFRISEVARGDGRDLDRRAHAEGWEGLIAKEMRSPYHSGRRSPAWRKLKNVRRQEFVVGGWTEPRNTRSHFGALLLGVVETQAPAARASGRREVRTAGPDPRARARGGGAPRASTDDGKLTYVGHVGTGFDEKELARVAKLLAERSTPTSPFASRVPTNERAHWVRPELIAEVRFTEWTDEKYLRHPVYLGLRDDKNAREVVAEAPAARASGRREVRAQGPDPRARARGGGAPRASKNDGELLGPAERKVVDQLQALEDARRDGAITLPNGNSIKITNPAKVFWPKLKITKGELLRYYVLVSPYLLPAVEDRPLVMKRFPNGITEQAFYQHRRVQEQPPPGVRMEVLPEGLDPVAEPGSSRFVGGSLTTLLYMTQIAAISQDPWFSRVQSPLFTDHVAIDLDPGEGATFKTVLDVARWVRDELRALGVPGVPKTSGSRGLHIYIPLPPKTTYESGQLLCQIIATVVATKHPKAATVERMVRRRPRGTVYVDYLQNILGKTLATAYSARASDFAGVSTPLTWEEVDAGVDPTNFTIRTAPARFAEVGDLWARLRTSKPADLTAVVRKYSRR
jgi:bifunctional non-homologous end joining protein LigD